LPIIEAMACGCPVISSNRASLPEIGGEVALFIDPLEISDMAESIKKVCEDTEYRHTLARRGPEHANNFNWETSVKKHMDLFEAILD